MANIVIVSGSPSKSSRLHGLTGYSEQKLLELGARLDTLYVADLPAEDLIRANFAGADIQRAQALVEQADAVILASPVYKASYTGVLKTFLDLLPQKGLQNKVVLPLFIGGTIAHLLAIDYSLKPVVSALGGTHMLTGVYAVDGWVNRLEDGGYALADELIARLDDSLLQLYHAVK